MNFSVSNKSWIILSTAGIIGIVFSIYFLVYVKGKEENAIENNFRILQQVALNIRTLESSFLKNAEIRSITPYKTEETNRQLKTIEKHQLNEFQKLDSISKDKILYGANGIYFKVDEIINPSDSVGKVANGYYTAYRDFYNNELFQQKDIFTQIIISKTEEGEQAEITDREIIYSNKSIGILDSALYQNTPRPAKDELSINDKVYISFNQQVHIDKNIILSGLVLKSDFEKAKRSVAPFLIFILTTALALIILAMPLIKLKIMSLEERLHSRDVVFVLISVLIGPAIFLIFLYTTFISFGTNKNDLKNKLKDLSGKIELNITDEMTLLMDQMDSLNDYLPGISQSSKIVNDTFDIDDATDDILLSEFTDDEIIIENQGSNKIKGYRVFRDIMDSDRIFFNHLKLFFWLTEKGEALIFLSNFHCPGYAQDLSHREYVMNIVVNRPTFFTDEHGDVHRIAIESIKSVNDGSYEIGIGKAALGDSLPVMAVSMKMASTMSTILEEGFGFCIIDKQGNTMFHSDITKNMNENFIAETQDSFLPSMASHSSKYENVVYNGVEQAVFFRPLNCLSDHYIATFADVEVYDAPFTLSMISAFLLFIIFLFAVLVVSPFLYFSNFKESKLKQNIKVFNFIRPYETNSFYLKYKKLGLMSLMVIAYFILSILMSRQHNDFIISEFILIVLVLLICTLYTLSDNLYNQYKLHSGIKKPSRRAYAFSLALVLLLLMVKLVVVLASDATIWTKVNALLGIVLAIAIFLEVFLEKQLFRLKYLYQETTDSAVIQRAYIHFLLLWVIMLSVIPINLFVHSSLQKEDEIFDKYRSLQLYKNVADWKQITANEFRNKFDDSTEGDKFYDEFVKSMQRDSINFALVSSEFDQKECKDTIVSTNSYFDQFYSTIRPNYNERAYYSSSFASDSASDGSWDFLHFEDKNRLLVYDRTETPATAIIISMDELDFIGQHLFIVIAISIVSIIILYQFLRFVLSKIFGFSYKKYADRVNTNNSKVFIDNFLSDKYFSNQSSYNNIFIVGVNSAHTTIIKNHFIKKKDINFYGFDFYDISEQQAGEQDITLGHMESLRATRFEHDWTKIEASLIKDDEKAYVLIEHFEFGYNDIKLNKIKLELLKYLVDCENFKVLIKSEINATRLLDFYDFSIKRLETLLKKSDANTQLEINKELDELRIDNKKWQHLLGSFVKYILPINRIFSDAEVNADRIVRGSETGQELVHGEFLNMLNMYTADTILQKLPDEDKILAIQQMSYPYYFSLWNSLSKEERYLVYDVAKDRFVNTVNSNAIMSLLSKGILIYDHSLRLMNESFADFVLTKVSSEEALQMEIESKKKGTWNTAFSVILLLIVSIVIFLSIGQQSFLNDINSFLTAIAALVGLLVRFSGFLTFGGNKTAAV